MDRDAMMKRISLCLTVVSALLAGAWGRSDYEYIPGVYHASGTVTGRPFDTATGIIAAYSTRKLLTAYAGAALRVRRSSDNTELDIGFNGTGDLDQTALTTFVGANSGYVTVWYDQSGAARNLSQATTTTQLRIVNAGVVDVVNTRVSPYAPSTSLWYIYTNVTPFLTNNRAEVFQIGSTDASSFSRLLSMAATGLTDTQIGGFLPTQFFGALSAKQSLGTVGGASYTAGTLISIYTTLTASTIELDTTGSSTTAAWTPVNLAVTSICLSIEGAGSTVRGGVGYKSEFIITNANQASPATFTAEQKTYWGAS
jgi:hypothetical protein